MTPSAAKIHALVAILATSLAACAPTRPPADVLGAASRNLATAREAGAATYAPIELRNAEERLDKASAAMAHQDYDDAADLAAESAANGELAAAKSRLAKVRQAVDTLRQQNEELVRDAERHAAGASAE